MGYCKLCNIRNTELLSAIDDSLRIISKCNKNWEIPPGNVVESELIFTRRICNYGGIQMKLNFVYAFQMGLFDGFFTLSSLELRTKIQSYEFPRPN